LLNFSERIKGGGERRKELEISWILRIYSASYVWNKMGYDNLIKVLCKEHGGFKEKGKEKENI